MTKKFLTHERLAQAPLLPADRPPTRREVWDREFALYHDIKTHDEMAARARTAWAYAYTRWFNTKGWRKQPDWVEGDPVFEDCVPAGPLWWVDVLKNERDIYACLERANRRRAA